MGGTTEFINEKEPMEFKEIVDKLLKKDDRSVSWLGRQTGRTPQAMRKALLSKNPTIGTINQVAGIFNITGVELIALGEEN